MSVVPPPRPRAWLRGIPGVLVWHGVATGLLAALVAVLVVQLNRAEGVEHSPDAWAALGIFLLAFFGVGLLLLSCLVGVLVMALEAPRVTWTDLARHPLAVSFGSLALTTVSSFTLFVVSSIVDSIGG